MLDRYILGDVSRISPEAPVPVVDIDREENVAGGAANVALNLKCLGASVEVCGWVGRDPNGDALDSLLNKSKITINKRFKKKSISTIVKTRVMVRNQQLCRLDQECQPESYNMSNEDIEWIVRKSQEKDIVIFSDYGKGVMSNELINSIQNSNSNTKPIMVMDPKPRRLIKHKHLDLITPNRSEALELAGIDIQPHEDFPAKKVCKKIYEQYKPKYLVITLGEEGMLLSERGKVDLKIPTTATEVFDVSGAGDTVIATLSLMLACGAKIQEAAKIANLAAGIVVKKVGTATVSCEELISSQH
tara:strand:- start:27869 stop:28774 length:906 start_codon:yes stop_codon:yes gene_type:complete